MKCLACGKPVTGEYVVVDRHAFHTHCFSCRKCGEAISGHYQEHKGYFYHSACYKAKMKLICSSCGKILDDSWVEHEGKKYHQQCLHIQCDICGSPITGTYTYDEGGKYHRQCFLSRKAPRCCACDEPIVGKYLEDQWGNRSHLSHAMVKAQTCDYCSRIISFSTSNGGYHYSDGRVVCGICKLTVVDDERRVKDSYHRVLNLLATSPAAIDDIPKSLPLQLVDRKALKRKKAVRVSEHAEGITQTRETFRDRRRVHSDYQIFLLHGMPRLEFEAVLAHELLHVWLIENGIKMSPKDTEGFCDLGAAMVYKAENSRMSKILLKRMEERTDRIYGKGYRKMNRKLKNMGWSSFKNALS